MATFILRRLLTLIPTLFVVMTVAFFMMRLAPGSPFAHDRALDPKVLANLEAAYGLDQPIHVQYWRYLKNFVQGDLGASAKFQAWTVTEIVRQSFLISLTIGAFALLFAVVFGMTTGVVAAVRQNTLVDYGAMGFAMLGVSIPNFVLAPFLIVLLSFRFHLLPAGLWGSPAHVILPAIVTGLPYAAYIARLTRAGMLEVLNQDYVRTARAKGLAPSRVILRHALKTAALPVVTFLGPATAGILTGSIVVERIFNIGGLGTFFVQGALNRDYPLIMAVVVLYFGVLAVLNTMVDVGYSWLDPRVRPS